MVVPVLATRPAAPEPAAPEVRISMSYPPEGTGEAAVQLTVAPVVLNPEVVKAVGAKHEGAAPCDTTCTSSKLM